MIRFLDFDPNTSGGYLLANATQDIRQTVEHLCRTNFLVFQKVELGFELGPHHYKWNEDLMSGRDVVEMSSRDHGKSHSLARAYPLWKAKYDPWVKEILLLGPDGETAIENLDKLKELMAERPSLRYLIPQRRDFFNSRSAIKLSNGKTIKAKSVGSKLRGRHPQLIILDDVVNEDSLDPDFREWLLGYFRKVVVPMKDKGLEKTRRKGFRSQIVASGTPQHWEDLYHTLLNTGKYAGGKMPAVLNFETEEVLWPERYSFEDLMNIKATVGSLVFAQEYQLEPISDETSLFPPSLFEPLKDPNLSYVDSYNGAMPSYLGADFSVPGSTENDWTVIFILQHDTDTNELIPLNYWRQRPHGLTDQVEQIELMTTMYNVTLGYLEDNMFQRIYSEHFANKSTLPLSGHTVTGKNKRSTEYGILGLRPLLENGRFRFPYKTPLDQAKTDHLISEFVGVRQKKGRIGNEQTHDDTVMALWHAYTASRSGAAFSVSW